MKIYLNNDWKFRFDYGDGSFENAETVKIPHTAKEIDYNYTDEKEYQTVCGYQHTIEYKKEWKGKRVFIHFDGVGHSAETYMNGELLGKHQCGYTGFKYEITDLLKEGNNELTLKVDTRETLNIPPFGNVIDYLCYGGIYRDVYLEVEEKDFIEDVYAYPIKEKGKYIVKNEVTINGKKGIIHYALYEGDALLLSGESKKNKFDFEVGKVKEWDLDHPNLYTLKYTLAEHKEVYETIIAFRTIEFKADGFYLNSKKTKLVGLDRHQSYPYVGYAMPDSMQKMDARILKEQLGLSIVRTSHYPQSHAFIDECDRLGLLVLTEFPGWQYIGNKKWKDIAVNNAKEMILEWRRHPSIILWGIRINESPDDDEFYTRTNAIAHKCDPYRPTTGIRCIERSSLLEDVYAHNDFSYNGSDVPGLKPKSQAIGFKANMDHGYIVTEYCGHMYPTKPFDDEIHRTNHALRHATVINSMYEQKDIAGCIGWCYADYNTHRDFGAGDRICYHGVLDMFRNPKFASYVYTSQQDNYPVLEVSSEMNGGDHPEIKLRDVYIFTNADSVRIYNNDRFVIEMKPSKRFRHMKHPIIFMDDFIGELVEKNENYDKETSALVKKALLIYKEKYIKDIPASLVKKLKDRGVSLADIETLNSRYIGGWGKDRIIYRFDAIKDGKVIKSVKKGSFDTLHLETKPYTTVLKEDKSYDVTEVFIRLKDNNDNVAEYYQEALHLSKTGPIEIIGPKMVSLKAGQLGVYVKTMGKKGKASLIIESERFGKHIVEFEVK